MDEHTEQLTHYIQAHLQAGTPAETIRQTLLQAGWDAGAVNNAIAQAVPQPTFSQPQTPDTSNPTSQSGQAGTPAISQPQDAGQQQWQQPQQSFAQPGASNPASYPVSAPVKYTVFGAIGDTINAIRYNLTAYILSAVLSAAIAIALVVAMGIGAFFFFAFALKNHGGNITGFIAFAVVMILIVYLVFGLVSSIIQTATALAVYDGAEGRKSAVKPLLASSMRLMPRLLGANLLVGTVAVAPLLVIALLGFLVPVLSALHLTQARPSSSGVTIVIILAGLAGIIWMIIALFMFALAPSAAIFEPQTPLRKTLSRSRQLMSDGGAWFIFKAGLLYLVIGGAVSMFSNSSSTSGLNGGAIVLSVVVSNGFSIILSIVANGTLVMLYHNRRIVHDRAVQA